MTTLAEAKSKGGILKKNPKLARNEINGRNRGFKFVENINDKPHEVFYGSGLAAHFKKGYPPRPLVEPMHQGHWTTLADWVDLEELTEDE